jgi:isoleucyl-tRNA synthetase
MDITKDSLYSEDKNSAPRRATQSAMAHIAKSMLGLVAPALFKEEMENVFDLVYVEVPSVEESFNAEGLIGAREKFFEAIDSLKKEKIIKSTLELEIVGNREISPIRNTKDLEDWFTVSAIKASSEGEEVAKFEVEDNIFTVHKATQAKCPRCWRFTSTSEDCACERCAEVIA